MADLDTLLSSAQGGQLIANLAERFGLSQEQMQKAVDALAPALTQGLENAVEQPEGLGKVVECLCASHEYCAHDHADAAHAPDAVDRGQTAVLSLFGSEDNTSQIVRAAAQQTGVSADILAQLLPILASVLFGGLNKSMGDGGMGGLLGKVLEQLIRGGGANAGGASGGGLGDILGQVIAGGQGASRGGAGGGGLGDILGQVIAGGQQGQRGGAGGGLGDILGQVLGGGQQGQRGGGGGLGGGLGDILGQVIAGGRAAPRGGQASAPGGGLGEIFGKVIGELARGGGIPGGGMSGGGMPGGASGGQDPRNRGGDPLETADASAGGLDQASVQQAIDKIKQSLQINRGSGGAPASGGAQTAQTDLEKVLGQIFGRRA
jgi:Bacterial protein of unknown function (DUF937)